MKKQELIKYKTKYRKNCKTNILVWLRTENPCKKWLAQFIYLGFYFMNKKFRVSVAKCSTYKFVMDFFLSICNMSNFKGQHKSFMWKKRRIEKDYSLPNNYFMYFWLVIFKVGSSWSVFFFVQKFLWPLLRKKMHMG